MPFPSFPRMNLLKVIVTVIAVTYVCIQIFHGDREFVNVQMTKGVFKYQYKSQKKQVLQMKSTGDTFGPCPKRSIGNNRGHLPRMKAKLLPGKEEVVHVKPRENMTLVTAYFDIGPIRKSGLRNIKKYMEWAKPFSFITNPLVFYTDSENCFKIITGMRKNFTDKTKVIMIKRSSLWPFQMVDKLKSVFRQPGYPKHYPNTVIPAYSALQHSKYALVSDTIRNKYFMNDFYSWIDIGYFRDISKSNDTKHYKLQAPPDLDTKKIAVNLVFNFQNVNPYLIFRTNQVWVGGGMFIGSPTLLMEFEQLYKRAMKHFLDQKIMNTDQQLLYALYSVKGRAALKPSIELQPYRPRNFSGDPWFYLGFHCRVLSSPIHKVTG